ncbi:MAG: tandem-95 repeat protein, partial [Opitutaceae bacterium]|nr:tandem-95 repeat protein [Opitutaceae bacterium]
DVYKRQVLNPDGSFTYTPDFAFSGVAAFTYRVSDGVFTSGNATVTITVNPSADILAIDGFSDTALAPWSAAMGLWSSSTGTLLGTGPNYSYSYAYLAGAWTDYSVEAQVRFAPGAYGGGLGGRLNASNGAHYGIWVYPGATAEAPASISIVKFRSWTDWSGTFMQQAALPAVGTSWHALKVTFQANRIVVQFDGVQVLDVTDNGYDNRAAYLSGGVSADMWVDWISAAMEVDNLVVRQIAAINLPPTAQNDAYAMEANSTLSITAPGVLANDSDPNANPLTAVLVTAPASGSLTLNADGSFAFTPAPGMTGTASFTYRAHDGQTSSEIATVSITVNAALNVLFADDFDDDTVAPWTGSMGTWNITGGALRGSSSNFSYGYAYTSAAWTDYSVEGLVQFSASGTYGGGLGGRLNAATGAHYGAWIYPEGSAGGSLVLRLVKFRSWTDWSGTAMAEVPLTGVGTTPRLLKLSFTGNRIVVSYDGAQVIDVTDNGFDNRPAYLGGGITADLWTFQTNAPMQIDDVLVLALP